MMRSTNYSRLQPINRNNELKILIVDDLDGFVEVAAKMVESWGYQVCTASSGEKAIEMYEEEKPNAVLMDLRMPGMDGFSAFKKIKEKDPEAKTFLMTAYGEDLKTENPKKEGILYVFEKPFSLSELKEKLITHLGRGKPTKI